MNKLPEMSNIEILRILEVISLKMKVELTPANRVFFVKLYNYVREKGIYDNKKDKYYIQVSNDKLSSIFSCSKTITNLSLTKLVKCKVIERIRCNEFRKKPDNNYEFNKASLTYINMDFWEEYYEK